MSDAGLILQWRLDDGFLSKSHEIGNEKCPECCCGWPERCEDCGKLTHGEPDEYDGQGHTARCEYEWCRCVYCPERRTGTGWPR